MDVDSLGAAGQTDKNSKGDLQQQITKLTENMELLTKMVQGGQGKSKQNKGKQSKFKWSEDGKPICGNCNKVGHYMRKCPSLKN